MKPTEDLSVVQEVARLCNQLVETRKDLDISQKKLADKLGISRATYRKKEAGIVPFTLPEFVSLNHILQLYTTIGKSIVIQRLNRVERLKVKKAYRLLEEVIEMVENMEESINEYGE